MPEPLVSPLYRIMSFRHVIDMFDTSRLRLSMPSTWDDPYEKLVEYSRQEMVFAQCWSKHETSDALWRIYSSDRMGLCVRTTRSRLNKALQDVQEVVPLDFRIDDVEYLPDPDAVERASALVHDAETSGNLAQGVLASLFIKRAAFAHEAEVRAAVHLRGSRDNYSPQLFLTANPHFLLDRVEFDPRADPVFIRICTHYLQTAACFEGEISRSTLYDKSDCMIIV